MSEERPYNSALELALLRIANGDGTTLKEALHWAREQIEEVEKEWEVLGPPVFSAGEKVKHPRWVYRVENGRLFGRYVGV